MPSARVLVGCQPVDSIKVISVRLTGVPSGLDVSCTMLPVYPTILATSLASSLILMSTPVPTFTRLGGSSSFNKCKSPRAKSSTCKNSRRGSPLPQIVTSSALFSLAREIGESVPATRVSFPDGGCHPARTNWWASPNDTVRRIVIGNAHTASAPRFWPTRRLHSFFPAGPSTDSPLCIGCGANRDKYRCYPRTRIVSRH